MSADSTLYFPLEGLPNEILIEIGSYLSKTEIKNLSLSSSKLNDILSNNVSTLKKLRLILSPENIKNVKKGKEELSRSYANVFVNGSDEMSTESKFTKNTALWLSSNFCSRLRDLTISFMNFKTTDLKLFRKSLDALHLLENLTLYYCDINGYDNSMQSSIEPAQLDNLKNLHLSSTHLTFLLLMKTPNLHSLKINNKSDLETSSIVPTFLADQPLLKLEQLAIWNIDFEDFEEIEQEKLSTINIPLRNLSLQHLKAPFKGPENVMAFLNRFTLTLEELNLGKFSPQLPDSAYELIFSKFHRVKTLRVNTENAPKDVTFYMRLPSNPSVTTFILDDTKLSNKTAIHAFFEKLPNIETLIVNSEAINRDVLRLLKKCRNLKHLAVKKFFNIVQALNNLKLDKIKTLSICEMKYVSPESWKKFIKTFPNLESLSIHNSDQETLNSKHFNIFTKGLKKMKHFMFGDGLIAAKRFFNQMLNNCKDLQTVEVLKSSFEDINLMEKVMHDFKKPGLRFICYENEGSVCRDFDQKFGTQFWRRRKETRYALFGDFTDDEDDFEDSDEEDYEDDDSFDSDYDIDSDDPMNVMINLLARAAHGPGGVPWYDSDTGEQQPGHFDSDGEWEPFEPEYYLDYLD